MRFSEGLREEILRRTDLVQLVGKRVKLDRKGRIFWGLCPFHKEKSPSFKVENERRMYHCFGCGAGGDAFKWVMETEGLSFPEAVQKLAGDAGVELPQWTPEDEARESRRKSLYEIILLASQYFEEQLHHARSAEPARAYLKGRGLLESTWKNFRLGYAHDSRTALIGHLTSKGVALEDIIEAGLARPPEEGKPARDFFFERVMFPIADPRGRIVAFGGRGLSPDAKPKYINTGETALFTKGRLLYNFGPAREAAFKGGALIVAEGYMDVIALVEAGFLGAVAPLGTALTEDQLALLWKVSPEPILCFDGDEAGRRAATRASRLALPQLVPGQSLRFVFLPKGEDPDSFIRGQGAEPMRSALAKAEPLADVLWKAETEGRDLTTPERRAGLEAELDRIVKAVADPKIADYYRRDFSERVFKAFKQRRPENRKLKSKQRLGRTAGQRNMRCTDCGSRNPHCSHRGMVQAAYNYEGVSGAVKMSLLVANAMSGAKHLNEQRILGLFLLEPQLIEQNTETLAWLPLDDPQLDRLRRELLNLAASGKRLDKAAVEGHLEQQGIGALVERLKTHSVLQSDLKGQVDEEAREALLLRTRAQLADPDFSGVGELKTRRDEALQRYLDSGANEDWEEVQRLNGQLRNAKQ